MDINQFIRIFKKNLLLLIAIPLLLAIIVFYLTRNQAKVYESESIIYTGITTGYSIESMTQQATDYLGTSAQFDNLINIINSRQTISESAIMLLAQDLCLERANPQYISKENFDNLQRLVPKEVKDLVVKYGKAGIEREKEEQIRTLEKEIKNLEKEMQKKKAIAGQTYEYTPQSVSSGVDKTVGNSNNQPVERRIHVVKTGETLLTISNQYGISLSKLRELNNLSSSTLFAGQQIILSEQYASNNTISNQNKTVNLYDDTEFDENEYLNIDTVTASSYVVRVESGRKVYEKDPIIPPGVLESDYYKTVENLTNFYNSSDTNFVYGLLHYGQSPHYSISSLKSSLQIYRINTSDLVRLVYTSDDPGICQQTLKIISNVFVKNYRLLRINQTNSVVEYFQRQVDSADRVLKNAEDRLLKFNKKNNIINYQEQTKYIASQKEDLDLYYQNQQVRMAESSAALRELETKLTRKDSIYLKSDIINQKRKELAELHEKIIINELSVENDIRIKNEITKLQRETERIENEIKLYVDQLYLYGHSTQGITISNILNEWLVNALLYEQAKASLVVLTQRKMDFVRTYQRFAPLGAMLKRIEREIQVSEQSYLALLNSLNMAKMRQQNLSMSTNIRIVDPPFFPISAKASKAKFLVLVAFLIGFFLVAFVIIILEYFDSSLKTPERVAKKIGVNKIGGAYPYINSEDEQQQLALVTNRLIDLTIQNLKMNLKGNSLYPAQKPYFVLFFSMTDEVGKTLIMNKVADKLRIQGEKVFTLNFKDDGESENDNNTSYIYSIGDEFSSLSNLQELINNRSLRMENYPYDYIFLEIPSILYHAYPIELLQETDASIMIVKASETWSKADIHAFDMIKEIVNTEPIVVLNEAEDYALQEIVSGVKVHRSDSFWAKARRVVSYPGRIRIQVKEN